MSTTWPPLLHPVLTHGPLLALAVALIVSPGAHGLLAAGLERRILRPRQEFAAVVVGDPLLALACACGVWAAPTGPSPAVGPYIGGDAGALAIAGCWLGFGLWQWRFEIRTGYYTRQQAWAPTKIWHQLGVYPLLGPLVTVPALSGITAPHSPIAVRLLIPLSVAAWFATIRHDRHHTKLGHPPYDWQRLRPRCEPWPTDSGTLIHHGEQLEPFRGKNHPTERENLPTHR